MRAGFDDLSLACRMLFRSVLLLGQALKSAIVVIQLRRVSTIIASSTLEGVLLVYERVYMYRVPSVWETTTAESSYEPIISASVSSCSHGRRRRTL